MRNQSSSRPTSSSTSRAEGQQQSSPGRNNSSSNVNVMMPGEVVHTVHVDKGPPTYSAAFTVRGRAEPTGVGEGLQFNARYFASIPGIIKIVQLVLAVVCMICISPPVTWFARLFTFVIAYSFAVTLVMSFGYLVSLSRAIYPNIHWTFVELVYTIITTVAYFITAVMHLALTNQDPVSVYDPSRPLNHYPVSYKYSIEYYGFYAGYIAAGAFGVLNAFVYGAGAYFLFMEWKEKRNGTVSPSAR